MILQWDESFDIGSDTLTGVNDEDYKPPFTADRQAQQADDQGGPAEASRGGHQKSSRIRKRPRLTGNRFITCRVSLTSPNEFRSTS